MPAPWRRSRGAGIPWCMRHLTAAVVLLLVGCGSSEPPPEKEPAPARQAPPAPAPAPAPTPTAGTRPRVPHVHFVVKDADLATEVLPLFEQQAGIKALWTGDPRKVTLRLVNPIPWPDALDLVCQFTKTHPTRDYQDRLVLKNGWGGSLGDGDLRALERKSAASGARNSSSSSGGSTGGSGSGGSGGSGNGGSGGGGIPQPTGAYSGGEEANRILKGTSTTSSGPR